ncbi:MAG: mechanosensitive ion channel [Acidobacteriaceae bacterium]|nr:mechanosensitive ion channel [Acidobacteriaceae bacterium]
MNRARLITLFVLVAVFVLCIAFSWTTRDAMSNLPFLRARNRTLSLSGGEKTIVDLSPWQTAQALASLAVTTEEHQFAREAERLADHEVDQAFASALRLADMQRPVLGPDAQAIAKKIAQLQDTVKADQAHVDSLTAANSTGAKNGSSPQAVSPQDELKLAKAQLALDQDELADAQQDFSRASGDQRVRIQQELAAHQTEQSKYDAQTRDQGQRAVQSVSQHGTLAARIRAWLAQRNRHELLLQARQNAETDAAALMAQHNALETQAEKGPASSTDESAADTATRLATMQRKSRQRQILSIYDDRIESQQQLATVYGKWANQVLLQHRIVLHLILQSLAVIAFILICVILCNMVVRHFMERPGLDGRRMRTLRTLTEMGVQLVGLALILLVIFGVPSEVSTVVGLTTAGLTVALQSFILAFFGWFILMGKNGIRVGDWVEINGVGGEVIEISLFRTTLLETGNWTDQGHPTGRRVTFINNFAISGQYFNFSTAGQWMWDEFAISLPASAETYAMVELIQKGVTEETESDARLAEAEWQHASRTNGLTQFSAAPSVSLRPSAGGVDIVVRYVTRASDRFEMRSRLYKRLMEVLHNRALQMSK